MLHFLANLLLLVHPISSTRRVLAKPKLAPSRQWLQYWVVYGMVQLVELLFGWLLEVLPFYGAAKLTLAFFLFARNGDGIAIVYGALSKKWRALGTKRVRRKLGTVAVGYLGPAVCEMVTNYGALLLDQLQPGRAVDDDDVSGQSDQDV